MEVVSFSVENFRSITKKSVIPLKKLSILIGKNNEGKSNLLKALGLAMDIISLGRVIRRSIRSSRLIFSQSTNYNWERDFPISLQKDDKVGVTRLGLEFELSQAEKEEFNKRFKPKLSSTLVFEISIGSEYKVELAIFKNGKKIFENQKQEICEFVKEKIYFNYIPAVRTKETAAKIVYELIRNELSGIKEDKKYKQALESIKKLEEPILKKISKTIKDSVVKLVPNVKDVKISNDSDVSDWRRPISSMDYIEIDDGTKTGLELKGDGVKSLVTMALLKDMTLKKDQISFVAIEEPESHLHPEAVHLLKNKIYEIAEKNQVIISTHSPIFVDRENIDSNIIINDGKAAPARDLKVIREVLGIKTSDNLKNAEQILVVEGESDFIILQAVLPLLSKVLKEKLKENFLIIEELRGSSNIKYRIGELKSSFCSYHILLDNDEAGRRAKSDNEIPDKDITFVTCKGMKESEIEDTINVDIYKEEVEGKYGIDLSCKYFKSNKKKWSERMKDVLKASGKNSDDVLKDIKTTVASCVKKNPKKALNENKKESIEALAKTLEKINL
ncbi:ATP-dependent nuclease [Treponema denticola]|uniref:ATP-dependent nuclease n=1 Tax=Treponema denticola TaxID=158 RepID=UPI0020A3B774|nr:AAA family ATPase [Treponema denticola]UTC88529.1 AAA family ATPase [Treponema denticola]